MVSSGIGQQTNCTPTPSGLVAWWPGDGVALDGAGTNHGSLQNGTAYVAGYVGQAFSFDGADDRVFISESPIIDISRTTRWTIEAWIKPTSLAKQWPTIYSEGLFGVSLGLQSGTGLPQSWINNANGITGTIPVLLNQWSHIALACDGTNRVFFVNGAFAGTGPARATIPDTNGSAIGDVAPSDSRARFAGQIDELSIYTRALTSNEVASIYAAGAAGKCFTNDPAPVFLKHPASQTAVEQRTATLTGFAMGVPRPTYQWLFNGSPLDGATNTDLVLTNLAPAHNGSYALLATNSSGSATSPVAQLVVLQTTTTSNTTATGSGADTYVQSSAATSNFGSSPSVAIKTDTALVGNNRKAYFRFDIGTHEDPIVDAQFELTFIQRGTDPPANPSIYNVFGLRDGHAGEHWNESTINWNNAPGNNTGSAGGVISADTTLLGTFSLNFPGTVVGDRPSFSSETLRQFLLDDTNGLATLIVTRQQANFSVEIFASKENTDFPGPSLVMKTVPILEVPAPTITAQPQSQSKPLGYPATFSVSAESLAHLSYQWLKDGTNIPGANSASYPISAVGPSDAATYAVIVSHAAATTLSSNVTLTIREPIFNNPERFESGWGDWQTDNSALWQIGIPTSGPAVSTNTGSRAYSPYSVAATLLSANYAPSSQGRLVSPPVNLPAVSGDDRVILRFWQWYQYGTGDAGLVQISTPYDTNWTTLTIAATNGTSGSWTLGTVDLTQFQGQQVRIAFYHVANSDGSVGAGWFIDDVSLSQATPTRLELSTLANQQFTANGQDQYFVFTAPPGGHLQITLNDLDNLGINEIYVRRGALPTAGSYDYRFSINGGADQSILIPNAGAGDWFILAYNDSGPVPGDYTLQVKFTNGVILDSLLPAKVGNSTPGYITINGAGFSPPDTVTLVNGATYTASNVFFISASKLIADFNFPAIPTNVYQLRVTGSTNSDSLPFELIAGVGPKLETKLHVPSRVGYHNLATIYVEYKNSGDAPMPAPLLTVSAEQLGRQGAFLTLDSSRVVAGILTTALPDGFAHSVQFLGGGDTPGLLQPGESKVVPVHYVGWQGPWDFGYHTIFFNLGVLQVTNTTAVPWDALKTDMRPSSVSTQAWDIIFANLTNQVGGTWGNYIQTLDDNATYLAKLGEKVNDIRDLLRFEVLQASGLSVTRNCASAVDAQVQAPGPALVFTRNFSTDISQHFALGRFGYGWSDNWETSLTLADDGTVTIFGPGGSRRVFQPDSRYPTYFAQAGDNATLTSTGGGAFTLRETDGTLSAFRADGKLDYVQDPHTNRITATWTGNLLTRLDHSSGPFLQLAYSGNRVASITDSLNRQTTFIYDGSGEHLASAQNYRGELTTYSYVLTPGSPSQHALTQVINPGGVTQNYTYDARGRLASRAGCCGAIEQVNYSYDSAGMVAATDALTNATKSYFDHRGLLVRSEDPLGNVTQRAYDANGNLMKITDAAGRIRTFDYDERGNRITETDQLGYSTRFAFTSDFNKLGTLIDAKGNVTCYGYEPDSDLASITYADNSVERWGDNALGGRLSWTNRRSQAILYTNDTSGRVIARRYPDNSVVAFRYDLRGNLTNFTDATGSTSQEFYTNDRLRRITYPAGQWLQYTYDTGGRRASMEDQLGHRTDYHYDARGRLEYLTDDTSAEIVRYEYDEAGRQKKKTLGNAVYTTYAYNGANQLTNLSNFKSNGVILSRFVYTYDRRGRRTTMTTTYGPGDPRVAFAGLWRYDYDDTSKLIGWTAPWGRRVDYIYDALGNRLTVRDNGTNISYTVNNLNQYTLVGSTTYQYDADGNLTNRVAAEGTTAFVWSPDNKLTLWSGPGMSLENFYNAIGNRMRVEANGTAKDFVIDPAHLGNVVGEYLQGTTNPLAVFVHGDGLVSRRTGSDELYYTFDALGSTSELIGDAGAISNAYSYTPFGELSFDIHPVDDAFKFVGEHGVVASDGYLGFMRARAYDSQVARFISPDPLGLSASGVNLYAYANNAPTRYIDPIGAAGMTPEQLDEWWTSGKWKSCKAYQEIENLPGHPWNEVDVPFLKTFFDEIFRYLVKRKYGFQIPGAPTGWGDITGALDRLTDVDVSDCLPPGSPADNPNSPNCESSGGCSGGDSGSTQPSAPTDPNSKVGPMGFGSSHFIHSDALLPYTINFENESNATAPAQQVFITDPLTNTLDWQTFELTEIAFGDHFIAVPPKTQHFQKTEKVGYNGVDFEVQIEAGIHLDNGQVYATFRSLNPTNGLPPTVDIGFLPPENGTGRGQGHIGYIIRALTNLTTGSEIRNTAAITFDYNPALRTDLVDPHNPGAGIDTNKQALVTIDADAPTSSVTGPSGTATNAQFTVTWSGSDNGSGIVSYDLYVQTDGGPWTPWVTDYPTNFITFLGQNSRTYGFYSVAHDGVGNVEVAPSVADVTVVTSSNYPPAINSVSDQSVVVGQQLVITNSAYDPDGVLFVLGAGAPAGATVATNGVFRWTPACAQGSTTNPVTIWAVDLGVPPLSNSVTFTVTVPECIEARLGNTVVQAGQTSSVPVLLLSTTTLTNMAFTVLYPEERFTNFTLTVNSPQVVTQRLQSLGAGNLQVTFTLPSDVVLHGPTNVGALGFVAATNQSSSFVFLPIADLTGRKADGGIVGNAHGQAGRVVVVGNEPLLEAYLNTNRNVIVILYGIPGSTNEILGTPDLSQAGPWPVFTTVSLSNLFEFIEVNDPTNATMFFRARRP